MVHKCHGLSYRRHRHLLPVKCLGAATGTEGDGPVAGCLTRFALLAQAVSGEITTP